MYCLILHAHKEDVCSYMVSSLKDWKDDLKSKGCDNWRTTCSWGRRLTLGLKAGPKLHETERRMWSGGLSSKWSSEAHAPFRSSDFRMVLDREGDLLNEWQLLAFCIIRFIPATSYLTLCGPRGLMVRNSMYHWLLISGLSSLGPRPDMTATLPSAESVKLVRYSPFIWHISLSQTWQVWPLAS